MSQYTAAKDFIAFWYSLVKAVQIYDPQNDVVLTAVHRFIAYLNDSFQTGGTIEILRYRDYIFYNKLRLRYEIEGYAALQHLHDRFKQYGIRSLTLLPGFNEEEAVNFALLFLTEPARFAAELNRQALPHVTVVFSSQEDDQAESMIDRQQARRTYYKALKVTRNLIQNLWSNQPVNINSFRRVVYTLIDSLSRDELGITALVTIKNFDEYTYNHSLNVGVLALAMGQRLGLSRTALVKLGTAGLLHDIGKVEIDKGLLYKAERLTDEEWQCLQKHSLYSVRQILKTRGLDDISISALVTAYQHHWNVNGTGYPVHDSHTINPTFLARIIRICDAFDAMTTPRPYHPIPYIPAIAVRVIWERAGIFFDPILCKVFVQLFGVYPLGSCLEFVTGEIGVVIKENSGWISRPVVKILFDGQHQPVNREPVELSTNPAYEIRRPLYPQEYHINPADHLV